MYANQLSREQIQFIQDSLLEGVAVDTLQSHFVDLFLTGNLSHMKNTLQRVDSLLTQSINYQQIEQVLMFFVKQLEHNQKIIKTMELLEQMSLEEMEHRLDSLFEQSAVIPQFIDQLRVHGINTFELSVQHCDLMSFFIRLHEQLNSLRLSVEGSVVF